MPSSQERFSQLRWLHNVASVVALIGSLLLIFLGLIGKGGGARTWMLAGGVFALFLTLVFMVGMALLLKMELSVARQLGELRTLADALAKQAGLLSTIAENTRLSDAAKSLAHREQELDHLRGAIRDEFRRQKWESAAILIEEMERRFGFRQEADAIREELDDARRQAIQSKLNEAISVIEAHFKAHEWDRARREIDRLTVALPGNAKVLSLQDRMKVLREEHKHELKLAWEEAVRRSDTDHAIDILRELDEYLSPAEAEALQASARDVFKEKLLQLGVQFRFAVTEKRWQDAVTIGLELVRDFPNARMAVEVREALDTLRERAALAGETPAATG